MRTIDADALKELFSEVIGSIAKKPEMNGNLKHMIRASAMVIQMIDDAPSIQPETNCSEFPNNWIPCSDRMPEEHEWIGTKRFGTTISDEVYVTFEAPDGQRFTDHISFQNGKLSRSDEHRMKVLYKGAKPIAWKPQPEPYQEGGKQ